MSAKKIIGGFFIAVGSIIVIALAVVLIWFFGLKAKEDNFFPVSYEAKGKGVLHDIEQDVNNGAEKLTIEADMVEVVTANLYDQYAGTDGFIEHLALQTYEDQTDCTLKLVLNIEENPLPTSLLKLEGKYQVKAQIRLATDGEKILIGIVKVDVGKSPIPAFIARPLITMLAENMKVPYENGYLSIDRPSIHFGGWGTLEIVGFSSRAGNLVVNLNVQRVER